MAQYGELIISESKHDPIYAVFAEYFDNPKMTKVKTINGYSMYVVKIRSHLSKDNRYLIVFSKQNFDESLYLENIQWDSLQTRTLDNHFET